MMMKNGYIHTKLGKVTTTKKESYQDNDSLELRWCGGEFSIARGKHIIVKLLILYV